MRLDLFEMSDIPPDNFQVLAQLQGILTTYAPDIVLPLPDGVLSFTYRLVVELVRDCLTKYQQGRISSKYLEHLQENIRTLVQQAEEKSTSGKLALFTQLAQNVLYILERPSGSLERQETSEGDSEEGENLNIPDPNTGQRGLNTDLTEGITVPTITHAGICETPEIQESASASIGSLTPGRNPCKTDYMEIKQFSSGGFGTVHLVRHKDSNQLYAMKKMDKQILKNPQKLERAFLERDILAFADCPSVASMLCSFPTTRHLCIVMEYVPGGDCSSLMNILGPLPLPLARLYIAETVLAVEYLHSYGVVHRDLKPENLLVSATGHIKVTDFGLSKLGIIRPTSDTYKPPTEDITREFRDHEIGGTTEYTAPEVILKEGYGRPIDWWSVGIILYEFLLYCVPFQGNTKFQTYSRITRDDITWTFDNHTPPPDAQDIITELLRKDPAHRLGTGGAKEIKMHPFLRDLNFDNLLSKEPHYIPDFQSEEDTGYFEPPCGGYQHIDSEEGDISEGNDWPESLNFISSSQRLLKLCSTNTRVMNDEEPKSPPVCSPESAKHSEIQEESSPSQSDGDKQCFTAKDSESSPSSELPVQGKRKLKKQQKPERVEEGESRRGSIFRRVISSCRRRLSRAAHSIRESCLFAACQRGSINIARAEKLRD
ncbi:microtubule-associated serine/threonine-protein kinase 4-like [Ranitomeya variabilis]|uniref:microtubule-associated serine/threonine-protein kinase 4-like n=1 Tax=Ranitomeya variabilis TaxID=490064 RepID=UPI0040564A8E